MSHGDSSPLWRITLPEDAHVAVYLPLRDNSASNDEYAAIWDKLKEGEIVAPELCTDVDREWYRYEDALYCERSAVRGPCTD